MQNKYYEVRKYITKAFTLVLTLILCASLLPSCAQNDDITALSREKLYITGNAGEKIDMSSVMLTATHADSSVTEISAADLKIKLEDGGKKRGNSLVFDEAGVYMFTVNSKNTSLDMCAVIKEEKDDEYKLFSENFIDKDITAVLETLRVAEGDAASITVENNGLTVDGSNGTVTVMLPEYLGMFSNYKIDAKIKIVESSKKADYAAVMYHVQMDAENKPSSYYTMAMMHDTAENGVVFGAKKADDDYKRVKKVGAPSTFNPSFACSAVVNVNEEGALLNLDYEDILRYTEDDFAQKGQIGIQASGTKLWLDDIDVYLLEDDLPQVNAGDYVTTYQAKTEIAAAASVVSVPDSLDTLKSYVSADKRPASAVIKVDSSLNASTESGTALGTVEEVYNTLNLKLIPIFSVSDADSATALAKYLKQRSAEDFLIMAKDADTITAFKKANSSAAFIYDFTGNMPEELIDVRDICNISGARIALLPEEALIKADVEYLQKLALTVWGRETTGEGSTTVRLTRMMTSGVQGIVSSHPNELIDIIESYNSSNTLMRKPFIIAHRGASQLAPENTIAALKAAYENGADIVECDIQVTKDGQLVVIHDSTIDRTSNTTGSVSSMTLAELQQTSAYAGKDGFENETFPSFEDFLKYIKDKDIVLDVEMKGGDGRMAAEVKRLIDKYDVADQVFVISFSTSNLSSMKSKAPELSLGNLSIAFDSSALPIKELQRIMPDIISYRSSVNSSAPGAEFSESIVGLLKDRGVTIWPWTFSGTPGMIDYVLGGSNGLTTDAVQDSQDWVCGISYKDSGITLAQGGSIDVKADTVTYGRTTAETTPEIVVIDGSDKIEVSGGKITAKAAGEAYILLKTTQEMQGLSNRSYDIYTQPIKVTVQ